MNNDDKFYGWPETIKKFQKKVLKIKKGDCLVDAKNGEGFLAKRSKRKGCVT